jgi:ESS family glutamate:Na+ symporter
VLLELDSIRVLAIAIGVLWLGGAITSRIALLRRLSIPIAVTGGILCSLIVASIDAFAGIRIIFDLSLRDTLLLTFFSSIGLSAKFRHLRQGGKLLARLAVVTVVFLILQNAVGLSVAALSGTPLAYGLIGGSVSLAGGHGTAITWGRMAVEAGHGGAVSFGLAFATFGLICGGIVGGPIARRLISRHSLTPAPLNEDAGETRAEPTPQEDEPVSVTSQQIIRTIFFLAVAIGVGGELNRFMGDQDVVLPGFLTAMAVGILLTNLSDARDRPLDTDAVSLINQVSLHLFLAMSLMSMQLIELAGAFGPVLILLTAQVVLAVVFASVVVFRVCGRDYDAAVMAAGYAGLGLGATPVGVANMSAVSSRFGPAPTAFLVIPLVGAFLLDIINAFVIQLYIQLLS